MNFSDDETEEERLERVQQEVYGGMHRGKFRDFLANETDFVSDAIDLLIRPISMSPQQFRDHLVSQLECHIYDFAETNYDL